MPKSTGVLIFFDESQRRELIRDQIVVGNRSFSDALSVPDWELKKLSIALLSFSESKVDFISLVRRGRRVATAKYKVEFSELIPLAIPIEDIEARLHANLRRYLVRSSRGVGGSIPQETWNQTINIIKELRPSASLEIDHLLSLRDYAGYRLVGPSAEVLLQEREALGAALDIFSGGNQLREKVLGRWAPPHDSVQELNEELQQGTLVGSQPANESFTNEISKGYIQEESALQHDLFNWEGMTPIHQSGRSRFRQGSRVLEVHYANRNDLEHTLGVDLIYYNQEFELFALVQYKLMHKEDDTMVYRPDKQLHEELERMDRFVAKYHLDSDIESDQEFRLNSDGFFVKLVPNYGLRPASGDLIKGMYLTREYLRFLLGPNGPKGSRGGRLIHFDNAPRYLTNTDFTQVVNRGWIGMRRLHTDALRDLINRYYETGRAILLAYETSKDEPLTP
jgi:hypothetical protein